MSLKLEENNSASGKKAAYVCVVVKEVGEGKGKNKGENDKGREGIWGHEVRLDRTMGLQVTFEHSLSETARLQISGKRLSRGICFYTHQRMKQI